MPQADWAGDQYEYDAIGIDSPNGPLNVIAGLNEIGKQGWIFCAILEHTPARAVVLAMRKKSAILRPFGNPS